MIEASHLHFSYDSVPILKDVTFRVEKGEFIGIVGPNGGGKTTLLKLLLGLAKPKKGEVKIDPSAKVGYVPQLANFDRDFPVTTLDLVLMGCTNDLNFWGKYSKEAIEKANCALEKVGLLSCKDQQFGELSGGQARRALIARAIVDNPTLLVLDEPTANIDMEAESSICKLLISFKNEMTILMVTHELPGIIPHVDRVFCIQHTLSMLTPDEVCNHTSMGIYHQPKDKPGEPCCDEHGEKECD